MPRVCQLITRLILGGAQRIALETAAHLAAAGWEVELWAGPQRGPEGTLHAQAQERGVPVVTIPQLVRQIDPVRDLRAYLDLRRRFARRPFDLVHTHSSKAGILGRLAAADAGIPHRVHTVHGWGITPETGACGRLLYAGLERVAARRAERLIAVSQAVRDFGLARRIGEPARYQVIHGGIPPTPPPTPQQRRRARHALQLPPDALVLGTLGRLDDAKDPVGAVHALEPLLARDPRLHAVFIGDGPLRSRVQAALVRAGLLDRVRLAGLRRDGPALLAACDVFFLSSRWEGFPLAVLEAMAAGLPAVAYAVAGVREAILEGETGYLVSPGDVATWRARLAALALDPALRARLGAAARARAMRRFSLAGMLEATLALYRELLDRRSAPR